MTTAINKLNICAENKLKLCAPSRHDGVGNKIKVVCGATINCIIFTVSGTNYKFQRFGTVWGPITSGSLIGGGGSWVLTIGGVTWTATGTTPPITLGAWSGPGTLTAVSGTAEGCPYTCYKCLGCCYSSTSYLNLTISLSWSTIPMHHYVGGSDYGPTTPIAAGSASVNYIVPFSNAGTGAVVYHYYVPPYFDPSGIQVGDILYIDKLCSDYPPAVIAGDWASLTSATVTVPGPLYFEIGLSPNFSFDGDALPATISQDIMPTCCHGKFSGVAYVRVWRPAGPGAVDRTSSVGGYNHTYPVNYSIEVYVAQNACCHDPAMDVGWSSSITYPIGLGGFCQTTISGTVCYWQNIYSGNVNHAPPTTIGGTNSYWIPAIYCNPCTKDSCAGGAETLCT